MDQQKYHNIYKDNPDALRKYIGLLKLYEYLAFTYSLRKLNVLDPLGYEWPERWAKDLLRHHEFLEGHDHHKSYYPHFAEYIDKIIKAEDLRGKRS